MGGWGRPQFHQDMALLTFDLQADLRDAFNWNVKQLFLFVVAEYSTPSRVSSGRESLHCLLTCSLTHVNTPAVQ